MWTRIVLKPWWARALISAGVCAIFVAADWRAHGWAADPHESWLFTLVGHVEGIVFFGLLVAAFTSNSHQGYTNVLYGLDPARRSAAIDASFRGPVPADAPVRVAAIRVAGRRLQSARFWRAIWLMLSCVAVISLLAHIVNTAALLAHDPWKPGTDNWQAGTCFTLTIILCFAVAWYVSLDVKHRLQALGQTQMLSPFGTATS
jgi:hypothetical protein